MVLLDSWLMFIYEAKLTKMFLPCVGADGKEQPSNINVSKPKVADKVWRKTL